MKKQQRKISIYEDQECFQEPEISVSEWKNALEEAYKNDEGNTTNEISKELGLSSRATQRFLKKGIENGTISQGFATRKDCAGRMQTIPVYRIVKKGSK